MDRKYILHKLKNQREYLSYNALKNVSVRISALRKLRENIKLMYDEICEALKKDLNKSKEEAYMSEIGIVLDEISYFLKNIKKLSRKLRVSTPISHFPAKSYKVPCPYGSVLILSSWNYPFLLTLQPLVDAISAGNCVVLKPSEFSSNVSDVIDKLIKITFLEEQVFVVQGDKEIGEFLLEQEFDYIFYTGSTRVGKIVMQKAAEHFTPVTLEMGGKSPCIVDETANVALSAKRIVFGKLLNAGQTCVAPDYILCHQSVKNKLVEALKNEIISQYSVSPLTNPNYPKMINQKQFHAMINLIEKKEVIFGGKFNEKNLKIEPTLLDSTMNSKSMKQEIFGPILPIITYTSINDCIEKIKSLTKPLAFYLFSNSRKNQKFILDNCDFGGGCINDTIMHIANHNLGFGGLKESGIGQYHGKTGFDTFTHYKSILHKSNFLDLPIRYQPISKFKYFLIKLFLR